MTQQKVTRSLEIDPEEIDRVEAFIPALANDPLIRAAGKVTSARVLRVALAEGLVVLEERYDVMSPEPL
jgi:limonene-1,2-epoxide hydrolase